MLDRSPSTYTQSNRHALSLRSVHLRWLISGFLIPIAVALAVYMANREPGASDPSIAKALPQSDTMPPTPPAVPEAPISSEPPGETIDYVVRRADTLERIFRKNGISVTDLAAVRALPGISEHVDDLAPGDHILLTHVGNDLQKLAHRISDTATLTVTRGTDGFAAQIVEASLEIRTVTARGVIDSSLFAAGRAAGMSSELVLRLANDIFGWDIDFALDIQPNDRFTVVYEQKYRDGEYLSDGRILAAEFVNDGHVYRAVRFESHDGKIAGYFTPDGKSMRKQFLRAPVDFKYISSGFNLHRMHPILNIIRAHQGVDYAAPRGTPVKAAGDGRVAFEGKKGGYGNALILEHGGGISTLYGHLSGFAKNVHIGTHVEQGEIIAYVGSTGLATAPHLHYEYRINGVHKNPRTVPLPDAKPIPLAYMPEFAADSGNLLAQLDQSNAEQVAVVPAQQ